MKLGCEVFRPRRKKGKLTTPGKKTKITVTANNTDPITFTMDADYENGGGSLKNCQLHFDKNAGPFRLVFSLKDETSLNLAFYRKPADAMYVAAGTKCPNAPGDGDGAIAFVEVKGGKLTVDNLNLVAQDLWFTLRFTGDESDDGPPYEYDPVMRNGGVGLVSENN